MRTKLSSSVHTRRAHNLMIRGVSSLACFNSTSIPSHQHLRCKSHDKSLLTVAKLITYRGLPPEKQELLCCSHLIIINSDLLLARGRRVVNTGLK